MGLIDSRFSLLNADFFPRPAEQVAEDLLGKYLIRNTGNQTKVIKIVEAEAYLGPFDRAAHSRFGLTERNQAMFGPAGRAYIYLVYGMYYCLNVVAGNRSGAAVLIRAGEPVKNISGRTAGPGLVCRELSVDLSLYGRDLSSPGKLYISRGEKIPAERIIATGRVGIDYAGEWKDKPLRFLIKDNKFVSRQPR